MQHDLSFIDKSNLKWLKDNTIFLTVAGSHSYGTNIATSDIDYRGIAIAPKNYYFTFNNKFEQAEFKDPDCVIFDIRKFFALAVNNNPNCIEIIFTDPKDHLIVNPIMKKLFDHRYDFLCKRARYSYEGYAFAQFKRIRLHNNYLRNPIDHKPTRKEFGLPEHTVISKEQLEAVSAMMRKKLDSWTVDLSQLDNNTRIELSENVTNVMTEICAASIFLEKETLWKEAAVSCNINPNFVFLIQKEKEYEAKAKEYKQYQDWKKNRNVLRADLEAEFGFDCKHALHLVRLTRQCKEILKDGELIVKRPDAKELVDIRNGAWTYDDLCKWFDEQHAEIKELYEKSNLQYTNNKEMLDNICQEIIEEFLSK